MRIYKDRFYILETIPGISGFQEWNKREYRIVTGEIARHHRCDVKKEYKYGTWKKFRVEDGKLPEFQEVLNEQEMIARLRNNPTLRMFVIPSGYRIIGKYQSCGWYPTKEQAEKACQQMNYSWGTDYRIEMA